IHQEPIYPYILVEHGADISANYDRTIINSSEYGNFEIVKYLIDNGADITAINEYGFTPLDLSSKNGHYEIVKLLVECRASIIKTDNLTLILASENGHIKIVKLLVENGADIRYHNNYSLQLALKEAIVKS
ncbi:ankyrin containing protein, partial [Acanthamoeba polyphaga mimivirus]